jgi:hypothetical protein
MEKHALNEQVAWKHVLDAADQPAQYYRWCHAVLSAHRAGCITQTEAAGMMMWPQHLADLGQLEQTADIQIVMDYAADIFDGARYSGAEEDLDRDWGYIREVVDRHSAAR